MKRIVSSIAAVTVGLWLTSASALGLGEIDVRSHLNQRFDAVIPLTSVSAEEAADLRVGLASAEDFSRAGLERVDYLSSLRFAVRTDGAPRIEISSDKLEREPILQLLLEIRASGNRILRQYTVLLDPPGIAPLKPVAPPMAALLPIAANTSAAPAAQTPAASGDASSAAPAPVFVEIDHPKPPPDERQQPRSEPVKPADTQKSVVPAPAPMAEASAVPVAPVSGELYGPVKSGETLWSIATRVRGDHTDLSMDQVLLALFNNNPRAFDGGGIDGLSRGAMLSLPTVADIRALDAAAAHREVLRLRGLPRGAATPAPTRRAPKPVLEPVQIAPPPPVVSKVTAPAATDTPAATDAKPVDSTESAMASAPPPPADDHALAANTADAAPTEPTDGATPTDTNTLTTDSSSPDANASGPDTATTPNQVEQAAPPIAPTAVTQPKKTESLLQALLIPLILGLLLLFFLAWLFARWRARRAAPIAAPVPQAPKRMPISSPSTTAAAITPVIAPAAAAAATQKLSPQDELDRLQASISGRTQDIDTQQLQSQLQTQQLGVDAAVSGNGAAADLPPVDFDLTGQFATQTVQIDLDANDPVSEADFHLAYGLYDEAALLLRQAAEKEPERHDIGIKLAETYFAAGKTAEFEKTAAELKPKLSPAEWQKLAIMGQQLAPGSTQFSDVSGGSSQSVAESDFAPDPSRDGDALDFNFDSEPAAAPAADASLKLQADNGLDFKLDDLELPSLDVEQHGAPAATATADSNALDFDLGGFDAVADGKPAAATETAATDAHDATGSLDFDLGDFDAGGSAAGQSDAPPAAAAAEAPVEEFDFGAVSTEAGDLAGDEASTKLDLARAYLEMGDNEMARGLLDEVLEQGTAQQKQDAQTLISRLA